MDSRQVAVLAGYRDAADALALGSCTVPRLLRGIGRAGLDGNGRRRPPVRQLVGAV